MKKIIENKKGICFACKLPSDYKLRGRPIYVCKKCLEKIRDTIALCNYQAEVERMIKNYCDPKFDVSKVRISWDFGYCDEPRITIAYIDNDQVYFIYQSKGEVSGALAIEDIEEMWRKVVIGK